MMGYRFGMMWGWVVGFIVLIVIIGLVVFAIVKAADNSGRPKYSSYDETRRAMELLNQRLANGEIDEEEYKRKKDLLKS